MVLSVADKGIRDSSELGGSRECRKKRIMFQKGAKDFVAMCSNRVCSKYVRPPSLHNGL